MIWRQNTKSEGRVLPLFALVVAALALGAFSLLRSQAISTALHSLQQSQEQLATKVNATPASLGIPGPAGANGMDGDAGAIGSTGAPGKAGAPGSTGPAGAAGASGPVGPVGPTGANGADGADGADGATGPQGPPGVASCPNGNCLSLQGSSPGAQESGSVNISGVVTAGSFSGDGSALTGVDASLLEGNGAAFFQNASNLVSGTLADGLLSNNVTIQGNSFNSALQLVKLDGSGALPVLSGANLTNVNALTLGGNSAGFYQDASNQTVGTLPDARLSNNIARLNGSGPQSFTGDNQFTAGLVSRNASNTSAGAPVISAGANTGGTLDGGSDVTYYYRVSAITASGESTPSAEGAINGSAFSPISAPASAPTVAVNVSAGNLTGTYRYKITYLTANGETTGGTTSSTVSPSGQQVNLSNIPTGPAGTLYRRIYRTTAGGADGTQKLLSTLYDNTTTTYTDNTTDVNLRFSLPSSNTARTNTNVASVSFTSVTGATSYRIYRSTSSGAQAAYQTTASSPFTDTGAAGSSGSVSGSFQVQNAAGSTLLGVDTPGGKVTVAGLANCAEVYTDPTGGLFCGNGVEKFISRIDVYGHSLAVGGGASSNNYRYSSRIAAQLHAQENNKAVGGAIASWNQANNTGDGGYSWFLQNVTNTRTAAPYLPNTAVGIIHYGQNDVAAIGSSNLGPYDNAMRLMISRYRAGAVFEESASNVSFSGTWSDSGLCFGVCSGTQYKSTATVGDSVTISIPADFPGGTIAFGTISSSTGGGGLFNFTMDGSSAGSLDARNANAPGKATGLIKRFTGLSAGAHTLVATVGATQGSFAAFDYWQIESPQAPLVVLPTSIKAYNYSIYNGWTYQPNDNDISIVNNHLRSVAAEFDSNVVVADIENTLGKDPTNFSADGIHPNDQGHAKLAAAIEKAIVQAPVNIDQLAYTAGAQSFTGINQIFQNATDSTTALQVQTTSGSTVLDVDTTNQRVGIGTAAPTSKLDITAPNDGIRVISGATNAYALIALDRTGAAGTEGAIGIAGGSNQFFTGVAAGDMVIRNTGGGKLHIGSPSTGTNTADLIIDSSGNLQIRSHTASATSFQVQKTGGTTLLGVDTNDSNGRIFTTIANGSSAIGFKFDTPSYTTSGAKLLSVQNNAAEKFYIDKDGNVGVASGAALAFQGSGNTKNVVTKKFTCTVATSAGDVVVIDTANAGQLTTTTTADNPRVAGVVSVGASAGGSCEVAIAGVIQATMTTAGAVSIGDLLSTSGTAGQGVTDASPAAGTVFGKALSSKGAASAGSVWVLLTTQ